MGDSLSDITISVEALDLLAESFSISPAERQVMDALAKGVCVKMVVRITGKNVNTVKAQLNSLYKRLDVKTAMQAHALMWRTMLKLERAKMEKLRYFYEVL